MKLKGITVIAGLALVVASGISAFAENEQADLGAAVALKGSTATNSTNTTNTVTNTPTETTSVSRQNGNSIASDNTLTKTSADESYNTLNVTKSDTDTKSVTVSKTDTDTKTVDVTKTEDSYNDIWVTKTDTDTKTITKTDTDTRAEESYNTITKTDTDTKTVTKTDTDTRTEDSYNTITRTDTDTRTDSHDITIGDVAVAVAVSTLDGTVSNNTLTDTERLRTGSISIDGGAFGTASGIVATSQNTGFNSLVQQSVNVQANMGLNPAQ